MQPQLPVVLYNRIILTDGAKIKAGHFVRHSGAQFARVRAFVKIKHDQDVSPSFLCLADQFISSDPARPFDFFAQLRTLVDAKRLIAVRVDEINRKESVVEDFLQPRLFLVNYYWRSISRYQKHAKAAGRD